MSYLILNLLILLFFELKEQRVCVPVASVRYHCRIVRGARRCDLRERLGGGSRQDGGRQRGAPRRSQPGGLVTRRSPVRAHGRALRPRAARRALLRHRHRLEGLERQDL